MNKVMPFLFSMGGGAVTYAVFAGVADDAASAPASHAWPSYHPYAFMLALSVTVFIVSFIKPSDQ